VGVANPRHDQAAAFDANFQAAKIFRGGADGIIRAVQAVQPERMILLVQALRAQKHVQVSQGTLQLDGFLVNSGQWKA
jgi:hypothetical protein